MDAQYARTLVETGVIGLAVFLWLVWSVLKSGFASFRALREPEERGLALGFLAGTVGLLVHAIGANSFIIVRIMEPFWFFTAIVVTLPGLAAAGASAAPARQVRRGAGRRAGAGRGAPGRANSRGWAGAASSPTARGSSPRGAASSKRSPPTTAARSGPLNRRGRAPGWS